MADTLTALALDPANASAPASEVWLVADEARRIAGPSPLDHVLEAMVMIRKAAEMKHREVPLHADFWVNEGYAQTPAYREACKMLEEAGYKVELFYEERQFVNMFTIVRW